MLIVIKKKFDRLVRDIKKEFFCHFPMANVHSHETKIKDRREKRKRQKTIVKNEK
jgi:hypothetical protein